jgi:hypothetical protein
VVRACVCAYVCVLAIVLVTGKCSAVVCALCDAFVHDTLHNCALCIQRA